MVVRDLDSTVVIRDIYSECFNGIPWELRRELPGRLLASRD